MDGPAWMLPSEMLSPATREVAAVFLRLGVTAFGGPAAHIAAMDDEIVERRGWVTRAEFIDLLSATNVIPGPNSTELAIHLGFRRAGWPGLAMAGLCFILPATLIVWAVAWRYVRAGQRPEVAAMLMGMQPVVLAVVAHAVGRLGSSALRTWRAWVIATASGIALVLGAHELLVLAGAATAGWMLVIGSRPGRHGSAAVMVTGATTLSSSGIGATVAGATVAGATVAGATVAGATSWGVFLSFAKIGSVLFGSGYVLLAFLRAEFVQRHAWLSDAQLLDAIAIGQVTPGPVFTSATFVGYLLAGHTGAAAATAGIFLPAFFFVAISAPIVRRVRQWPSAAAALDGVNAASLAMMVTVVILLLRSVVSHVSSVAVALVAVALLVRGTLGAGWLLLGGALVGIVQLLLH